MNYIKVSIKDKNTLVLQEDAVKGSLISLSDLMHVDTTNILKSIDEASNKVYENKVLELKEQLRLEYERDLTIEQAKFKELLIKQEAELNALKMNLTKELETKHTNDLNRYKDELSNAKELIRINEIKFENERTKFTSEIKNIELSKDNEYQNKINNLNNEVLKVKQEMLNQTNNYNLEKQNEKLIIEKQFSEKVNELEKTIDDLNRSRSSLSVKAIGENLETWCDNEFNANNLIQANNIVWYKDNEVVDRTKADFIYKVYATDEKIESQLLTSAILEMKSEDKTSTNKQRIEPILKKLDSDRNKKNLEYAILVSELEASEDITNDIPIRRISEYDKMFVVRPQYFMTLLNIITAFGLKYKELLLEKEIERIKFKTERDILEEFENMKLEILDNSIRHINDNLSDILTKTKAITSANDEIIRITELLLNRHVKTVVNKINSFSIRRVTNKIEEEGDL